MVYVAISTISQGKVFVGFINQLLLPTIRDWLDTPYSSDGRDNLVTHYFIPVMMVDISHLGPVSISWRLGNLTLERGPNPFLTTGCHNPFHSTLSTYRRVALEVRDRPVYMVSGWRLPMEPLLRLVVTVDGDTARVATIPVNIIQISQVGTPYSRWGDGYDLDSSSSTETEPSSERGYRWDDSLPPPGLEFPEERSEGEE